MGVRVKIRTATWSAVSLAAALAMCVAGCTGGSKAATGGPSSTTQSVATSAQTTTSTPAVTSTSGSQATTSPSATTTTGAVKASQRCTTSQLDISAGPVGAGLHGSRRHPGAVPQHRGASACTMSGYPGVAGLDAKGSQVVQAQRTPNGYLGGLTQGVTNPPVVTLTNGQVASALVEGSAVPLDNATSCPTFPALLVTPPGETHSVRVVGEMPGCTGIAVHPIVAGSTGSQS